MTKAWSWLTRPSDNLAVVERRHARLLATLLVVLIGLGTGSASIQLLLVPGFAPTFGVIMSAVALLALTWRLLRAGAYRISATLISVLPCLGALGAAAANPEDTTALLFVSLGVGFAALLLSMRRALVLAGASVVAMLALGFVQPLLSPRAIIAAVCFNLIATGLLWVAARHRDAVENDRLTEQAQLLERMLRTDHLASLGLLSTGISMRSFGRAAVRAGFVVGTALPELRVASPEVSMRESDRRF